MLDLLLKLHMNDVHVYRISSIKFLNILYKVLEKELGHLKWLYVGAMPLAMRWLRDVVRGDISACFHLPTEQRLYFSSHWSGLQCYVAQSSKKATGEEATSKIT